MHRNNQHPPVRVQRNSIVQFLKKADFLKPAAGSVRLFCPVSVCLFDSSAQGIFYYKTGGTKDEAKI